MKKKISLRLLCAILMVAVLAMSLPLSAFAASVDLPFIIYVEIDEPMVGEHPDFSPEITRNNDPGTSATIDRIRKDARIVWTDLTTGKEMTESDVFQSGHSYEFMFYVASNYSSFIDLLYLNKDYFNPSYFGNNDSAYGKYGLKKTYHFQGGDNSTYKKVEVSSFDDLKTALEADGNAIITLTANIVKSIRPIVFLEGATAEKYGYDPFEDLDTKEFDIRVYEGQRPSLDYEDPQIRIVGSKVLDLNGYCINVADNSNVSFYLENVDLTDAFARCNDSGAEDGYERTLLTVTEGSMLTIRDKDNNRGSIHYDGWMVTTPRIIAQGASQYIDVGPIYKKYTIRDIIAVEGNATLIVENGTLEAGRSKEQWIVDGTINPAGFKEALFDMNDNETTEDELYLDGDLFNGYAYQQIWGSAIRVSSAANVYINGGKFFGRGQSAPYVTSKWNEQKKLIEYEIHNEIYRDAVIDGMEGATIVINGGFFNAKGGADVFYFGSSDYTHSSGEGKTAQMTIRAGSFQLQKVDYVRGLDAPITNDSGLASALGLAVGAIGAAAASCFGGFISWGLMGIFATATGGVVGGGMGMLFNSPATALAVEGSYGKMNISHEYLQSIYDRATYTMDYDRDGDGDLDMDMTVYDSAPAEADYGVILRIDPDNRTTDKLKVNYSNVYEDDNVGIVYYNPKAPITLTLDHTPYFSNSQMLSGHSIVYNWTIEGDIDGEHVIKEYTTTGAKNTIDPFAVLGVTPKLGDAILVSCRMDETISGKKGIMDSYSITTTLTTIVVTNAPVVPEALPTGDMDVDIIYPTSGDVEWNGWPVTIKINDSEKTLNTEEYGNVTVGSYSVYYTDSNGEAAIETNKTGEFTIVDFDKQLNLVGLEITLIHETLGVITLNKTVEVFRHSGYNTDSGIWNDDYTVIYVGHGSCRLDNNYFENMNQPAYQWHTFSNDRFDWFRMTDVDENGEPVWTKLEDVMSMPAAATIVNEAGVYAFGVTLDSGEVVLARPVEVCYDNDPYKFTLEMTGENKVVLDEDGVVSEPTITAIPSNSTLTGGTYYWQIEKGPNGWRNSGLKTDKVYVSARGDSEVGTFSQVFMRRMDADEILPGEYTINVYRKITNGRFSMTKMAGPFTVVVERSSTSGSIYIGDVEAGEYEQVLKNGSHRIKFAPSDYANLPELTNIQWTIETLVGTEGNVMEINEGMGFITPKNPGRVRITATATAPDGSTYTDSVIVDVPITTIDLITPDTIKGQQLKDLIRAPENAPYTIEVRDAMGNLNPTASVESGYPTLQIKIIPKDGYVFQMGVDDTIPKYTEWFAANNSLRFYFNTESGRVGPVYSAKLNEVKGYTMDPINDNDIGFEASAKITFNYVYDEYSEYERNLNVDFTLPTIGETYNASGLKFSSDVVDVITSSVVKVQKNAWADHDISNDDDIDMNGEFAEGQLYRLDITLKTKSGILIDNQPLVRINDELAEIYEDVYSNTDGFLGDNAITVHYYFYAPEAPDVVDTVKVDIDTPTANNRPQSDEDIKIGIDNGMVPFALRSAPSDTAMSDVLEITRVVWFVDKNGDGEFDHGEQNGSIFNVDGTFKKDVIYSVYIEFTLKDLESIATRIVLADDITINVGADQIQGKEGKMVYTFTETLADDATISADKEKVELGEIELGYTDAPSATITITSDEATSITASLHYKEYFEITVDGMTITVKAKTGLKESVYFDYVIIEDTNSHSKIYVPVTVTVQNTTHEHQYTIPYFDDDTPIDTHYWMCKLCGDVTSSGSERCDYGYVTDCEKHECLVCGRVAKEATGHEYTMMDNDPSKLRSKAQNCQELDTYWYSCSKCGKSAGEDPNAAEYFYNDGEWTRGEHKFADEWQNDGFAHYHGCTVEGCGYIKDDMATHDGGKATCTAKAVCSTCGYEYGALADHDYAGQPNSYYSDAGHAPECKVCGHHDVLTPHTPDRAEATATDPIKCEGCDYIITPVIGHTCGNGIKIDGKAASCETGDGWHDYYKCSGCNKFYTDEACTSVIEDLITWKLGDGKIAAHTPNADDGDCTTPILCSDCGIPITKAKANHTAGADDGDCTTAVKCVDCDKIAIEAKAAHTDENTDGKCDACSKDMPTTPGGDEPGTDTPGTDEPGTDDPNAGNTDEPKDEKDGLGTGAIVAIVVGSVLVAGVGGFALFWFVIKKKTWADFLAIFKKK